MRNEFEREGVHKSRQVCRDPVLRDGDRLGKLLKPVLASSATTYVGHCEPILFAHELFEDLCLLQLAHVLELGR